MPITIKQIADRAGVSHVTVSCALRGTGRIGDQTRQRIWKLAQELGYRPNAAAKATRDGRTGTIDLLMSTTPNYSRVPAPMLNGIHDKLHEHDLHLTVSRLSDERLTNPNYLPQILREYRSDGVLINYTHGAPKQMRTLIAEHGIPAVWIYAQFDSDCIYPDDAAAGRALTEHLLQLGHRRIAYVSSTETGHFSEADRLHGYTQAMATAGLKPQTVCLTKYSRFEVEDDPHRDDRMAASLAYLSAAERPTALVCYSTRTAMPQIYAAAKLGLDVPKDLSVATVGDSAVAESGQPLTVAILPHEQLGQQAVTMLLKKIANPLTALKPVILPLRFQQGATSGPVSGH